MKNSKLLWQSFYLFINISMEFEDSRNAIYCDPNAYIQRNVKENETKKVVFQEPYDCLPKFYLNNNFKRHDKDIPEKHSCNHENNKQKNGFDLKNLMPMITKFFNNKDMSNVIKLLGNGNGLNLSNIMSILGNGNLLSGFSSKKKENKEIKNSEICIKDFKRVE